MGIVGQALIVGDPDCNVGPITQAGVGIARGFIKSVKGLGKGIFSLSSTVTGDLMTYDCFFHI